MRKKIFNDEQKEWVKLNALGKRNELLTQLFNQKFKTRVTVSQIKKLKNYNHISSGLKSCNMPVGTERIDRKGYVLIKVAEPNKWIEKNKFIYESTFNKKIPKGMKVIFLDGDKTNYDPNNLSLVTDNELLVMNKNKLKKNDKELTKIGINTAKLLIKINEKHK